MSRSWQAGAVAVLFACSAPWLVTPPAGAAEGSEGTDRSPSAARAAGAASTDGAERAKRDRKPAPGDTRRAQVVKAGWWWAANEPPPETGLVAAPQLPSPTVPKGAVPVAAAAGDPEKVSAIEVRLRAEDGSRVRSLQMVLRESADPGATTNAEAARILACPVTELFWADGAAAAWKDQPSYDCGTKAVGKRNDKGLWRFDLTEIAAGWLEVGSTDSRSVVLVEDVEAPESFQVAFDGAKAEGIGLLLAATPPLAVTDPPTEGGGSGGSTDAGPGGGSGGGLGSSGGSLAGGGDGGLAPVADGPAAAPGAPAGAGGETATEAAVQPVSSPPAWYSGVSRTGLLLLPLALGLAYLIMLALGPDARPVPVTGRHGVSRALDRLRQAGRDLRSPR